MTEISLHGETGIFRLCKWQLLFTFESPPLAPYPGYSGSGSMRLFPHNWKGFHLPFPEDDSPCSFATKVTIGTVCELGVGISIWAGSSIGSPTLRHPFVSAARGIRTPVAARHASIVRAGDGTKDAAVEHAAGTGAGYEVWKAGAQSAYLQLVDRAGVMH